ncbi:MAG: hemerythrin domain-containing protein [Burkholderiaceae bacterium]|jgi:hemerythrin-like metal-binding protein
MNRFPWDPAYAVGHEALDAQHQQLLACCEALVQADEPDNAGFDARLKTLLALAEEHFDAEAAVLDGCAYPDLDELRAERQEFANLVAELVAPEHFNPGELQRFLGLWWVGHIVGSADTMRLFLAPASP